MDDGSLEDNVDSFLSRDDGQCSDVSKGMTNSSFHIGVYFFLFDYLMVVYIIFTNGTQEFTLLLS